MAELVRVAEASGADLRLELLELARRQVARVPLVVQRAKGLQPLVPQDREPVAELGQTDGQQRSDRFWGCAGRHGQDGGEALVNPPIQSPRASSFDGCPLRRSQGNRFQV